MTGRKTMQPTEPPILYTRDGCHLCERVEIMLRKMRFDWQPIDIDSDPELEQRYGLTIPVVRLPESGQELAFPFDESGLREFLDGRDSKPWSAGQ